MATPTASVLESIKDREFAYVLSGSRLRVLQSIPKLDVGSVHIEQASPGDSLELPRWIGEVLIELGLCESSEESFASEVFKAVNREKMAGDTQIARLPSEFYLKVRRHLTSSASGLEGRQPSSSLAPLDIERTRTLLYDLMALRLRKILLTASAQSPPPDIKERLTPEEFQIFNAVYVLLKSWRSVVLEGH